MPFTAVDAIVAEYGYAWKEDYQECRLYLAPDKPALLLDTSLFSLTPQSFEYVDYTQLQNSVMHRYSGCYRFCTDDLEQLKWQAELFLGDQDDLPEADLRRYGADRTQTHIDPTPPEFSFMTLFEEVFGAKALDALTAEVPVYDLQGSARYVDFVLHRQSQDLAIELNGERYHHPLLIKRGQYKSQLLKQNSLVHSGYHVYRWSGRGMANRQRFADEVRLFFGESNEFVPVRRIKKERGVFTLRPYQDDAVASIAETRKKGRKAFLVVLPTGTGKTEIFIEDLVSQFKAGKVSNALITVPRRHLVDQTMERLQTAASSIRITNNLESEGVLVMTYAKLLRCYQHMASSRFEYIVVDEAHHAVATGLKRALEHFDPDTLIGLTATDERLDQQKLEDVFGEYETQLTLSEAIRDGILPPVRAFRIKSNIDLSTVRFNGKEFVKSDLNKTVRVPSRDALIAKTVANWFLQPLKVGQPLKQGIVFCTDVKHAERMAKVLVSNGVSSAAVSGKDRTALEYYESGHVQFLCACDLITEGWDSPKTSVIVMARPTLSKVVYSQQIGRGLRHYEYPDGSKKEALYVIDVVDNYGASVVPWSLHSLFGVPNYCPFADLLENPLPSDELIVLDQLHEGARSVEPVDIINHESEFGNLVDIETLARELFVSTGTVKAWVKARTVTPAKEFSFGRSKLYYFERDAIDQIRLDKGLKKRTEESRLEDFYEFLEQRDYTFSYKIVMMLGLIKLVDDRGDIKRDELVQFYMKFYQDLKAKHGRCEKEGNPYNSDRIEDAAYMSQSMIRNPFEKFERKRFLHEAKDLEILSFDPVLWEKFKDAGWKAHLNEIEKQMREDLERYISTFVIDGVRSA